MKIRICTTGLNQSDNLSGAFQEHGQFPEIPIAKKNTHLVFDLLYEFQKSQLRSAQLSGKFPLGHGKCLVRSAAQRCNNMDFIAQHPEQLRASVSDELNIIPSSLLVTMM